MKKLYFCSNCHQFHPQKSLQYSNSQEESFLRFSDIFRNIKAPKAHPENMTFSMVNRKPSKSSRTPFQAHQRKFSNPSSRKRKADDKISSSSINEQTITPAHKNKAKDNVTPIRYHPGMISQLKNKNPPKDQQNHSRMKTNHNESTIMHSDLKSRTKSPSTVTPNHRHLKTVSNYEQIVIQEECAAEQRLKQKQTQRILKNTHNRSLMELRTRRQAEQNRNNRRQNKQSQEFANICQQIESLKNSKLSHNNKIIGNENRLSDIQEQSQVMPPLSVRVRYGQDVLFGKSVDHLDHLQELKAILNAKFKESRKPTTKPTLQISKILSNHKIATDNKCLGSDFCAKLESENQVQLCLNELT